MCFALLARPCMGRAGNPMSRAISECPSVPSIVGWRSMPCPMTFRTGFGRSFAPDCWRLKALGAFSGPSVPRDARLSPADRRGDLLSGVPDLPDGRASGGRRVRVGGGGPDLIAAATRWAARLGRPSLPFLLSRSGPSELRGFAPYTGCARHDARSACPAAPSAHGRGSLVTCRPLPVGPSPDSSASSRAASMWLFRCELLGALAVAPFLSRRRAGPGFRLGLPKAVSRPCAARCCVALGSGVPLGPLRGRGRPTGVFPGFPPSSAVSRFVLTLGVCALRLQCGVGGYYK